MEELFVIIKYKRDPICWREECITEDRTITKPSLTATRSSRHQVINTFLPFIPSPFLPAVRYIGGKLTIQYLKRKAGKTMAGIPKLRSPALSRLTVTKRTVARAYGGKLSHTEVRDR